MLGDTFGPAGGRHLSRSSVERISWFWQKALTKSAPADESRVCSYAVSRRVRYARLDGGHADDRAEDGGPGASLAGGSRPPRRERRLAARDHPPHRGCRG